jgi:hypothetical protein
MDPLKITLGGQEFSVPKPLTFGQLRVIEPLTSGIFAEVKAKGRFSVECYDSIATIIITAVGIANLDAQKLNAMPLTSAELYEAFKTICDASCMFAKPDPGASQGEARASIGDTSTQT